MESRISDAMELLSDGLRTALEKQPQLFKIDEIRLRAERELSVSIGGRDEIISGALVGQEDIERTFKTAFSYSMHSYSKELSRGSITTRGGNRVGICGTAALDASGRVEALKYVSSVNIRIAREIKGCADEIISRCFSGGLCGAIIIGAPASGKTTVLRDISRQLGDVYKISLIDELNEIAASYRGTPKNDVGKLTDIFVGYPKPVGVQNAVRSMSPRAIIADEIGTDGDGKALEYALHSGVRLITAAHAQSLEEALKKPAVRRLFEAGAFSWAVELNSAKNQRVRKID